MWNRLGSKINQTFLAALVRAMNNKKRALMAKAPNQKLRSKYSTVMKYPKKLFI